MKSDGFRIAVILFGGFLVVATVWLGGCASTPPSSEGPDREKIRQDSEKGMQDLKKEEERRGTSGY